MTTEERLDRIEKSLLTGITYVKKADPIKEWPRIGDDYWFLDSEGNIYNNSWNNYIVDKNRRKLGNVFKFEKEAKNHSLRLESMTNRWKPGHKEQYYTWQVNDKFIFSYINDNLTVDQMRYQVGRCFKTEEEAVKHRETYQGAWEELDNLPQ